MFQREDKASDEHVGVDEILVHRHEELLHLRERAMSMRRPQENTAENTKHDKRKQDGEDRRRSGHNNHCSTAANEKQISSLACYFVVLF